MRAGGLRAVWIGVLVASALGVRGSAQPATPLLPHPVLFVTQVPVPADFTTIGAVFGNHRATLDSVARGVKFRMYFPVELVLMVKAIVTFESVGRMLNPKLDVASVSQRQLTDVLIGQFAPLRLVREGLHGAPEPIDTLVKLPMLVTAGLRALEQVTKPAENPFAGMRGTMFAGLAACRRRRA